MVPQDPSPQAPQPARHPSRQTRDKRHPYLSRRGASPEDTLRNKLDINDWGPGLVIEDRIFCGHLSLFYCERALKSPSFHPSEFFYTVDPYEEKVDRLCNVLDDLPKHSRTVHVLPSARFGAFLRQAFTDLLSRTDRHCALYMVSTPTHYMALWLRVKANTDGTQELVVHVYDPNKTRVQGMARMAEPQDWDADGPAHDFLNFLCPSDDTSMTRELVLGAYFTTIDPDAHITLYELSADADGNLVKGQAPGPLTTNWCSNGRVLMALGWDLRDLALVETAILSHFEHIEAGQLNDPDLLLEVLGSHASVLPYILLGNQGVGQAKWEDFWWRTQDMELKVRLLRGEDYVGDHLLLFADRFNKDAMRWWLDLVSTLPVKHILEVLDIRDQPGFVSLECWVWAGHQIAGSAWLSIIQKFRAHIPNKVRWAVEAMSSADVPLLAQYRDDQQLTVLDDWATLLPEVNDDELALLLQAKDHEGVPALYLATERRQAGWIEWWGRRWTAAPAASKAQLLFGVRPNGEHALWPLARAHHAATFAAWRDLWRQLPDEQRAEALAANRQTAPRESVLHRAMTAANQILFDFNAGDVAFIRDWGACLAELPPAQRMALLRGSPPGESPALWQGLSTGHWPAVVAWAECLHLVTPDERTLLTALPGTSHHPVTQATRERAKRDATGFRAALQAMSETLPGPALEWLRALLPNK